MASKAFGLTAYYDSIISNWFNEKLNIKFPDTKTDINAVDAHLRQKEHSLTKI